MPKVHKIIQSFNGGELSLMDARIDQVKYVSGCRIMENFIPLIYGGVQERPGLQYIAAQKSNSAKGRVVAFEHSVDDTYILSFENQVLRFFKDGAQVLDGVGTEDLSGISAVDTNIMGHWLLNETEGTTIADDDGGTHNGTASVDAATLTVEGKVGSGAFDLDAQYTVEVSDSDDFSFTNNSNDTAFSIACWGFVTQQNDIQVLLSKWRDSSTISEWRLSLTNERKLQLHLADISTALSSNDVTQWKLNDDAADTNVISSLPQYPIDDADAGANTFTISDDGDLSASFPDNSEFTVEGSTANDGQYTVVSTAFSDPDFVITVASVTDGTDDGTVAPHAGVASANTDTFNVTGKINGALNFGGAKSVTVVDSDNFTFGDGSNDSAFSIAAWVFLQVHTAEQTIISKYDTTGADNREWRLYLDASEKLHIVLYDESANVWIRKVTDDALNPGWRLITMTYDGVGGAKADEGINLYVDNVLVAQTGAGNASYVAMEDKGRKVILGAKNDGSLTAFWQHSLDNVIIFNIELTTAQVDVLYNSGNGTENLTGAISSPFAVTDSAISLGWHFFAATCSTHADRALAANDIILYVDGVAVDSTATNDANYTAMQNGGEEVRIGAQRNAADNANEKFWGDKIDEVSIFNIELSAVQVASLYSITPFELTTPYLTADLPTLKFEQSADVMFIAHPNYEPRRLSRLSDTIWTLAEEDLRTGPFRDQNTDTSFTITPSATTGSITLTASGTGNSPFVLGTTAGHEPGGSANTSKSKTGALFKLVHASDNEVISHSFSGNESSSEILVPKGVTWDFVTTGTWVGTIKIEREYGNSGVWETVFPVINLIARNVSTSGTEEVDDAQYRITMSGYASGPAAIQFSIRNTSHIGIVEIASVISSTEAIGTVLKTLADITATHRWSEGSFSNRRGWPIDVTISAEERLTFAGNISEPLTTWGSVIGDFTNFKLGTDDDDALNLTLVGSGQQNRIRWLLSKNTLILGTVGGEHLLGASDTEEALTPSNIKAKLQTTYGSKNIAALIVNQAVLFVQRGGKKIREFLYNFEADAHKADDLTVFSNQITGTGIVDMAFQRTPDPILWCVRADGQMAIMSYERDQNVFAWSRIVSEGGTSDAEFESAAIIYGGEGKEDEVWVTVKRTINTATTPSVVRYVERFFQRAMPSAIADMKYLDSYITDTGGTTTISGLDHLEGEALQVLGDGAVQTEGTAGDFTVSSGDITVPSGLSKVQAGLGYTATVKPMKLDLNNLGLAVTKKINRGVFNVFETIGGQVGTSTSAMHDIPTGTAALFTGSKEIPLSGGYSREGDILARQTAPLPMTVLSFTLDVGANAD